MTKLIIPERNSTMTNNLHRVLYIKIFKLFSSTSCSKERERERELSISNTKCVRASVGTSFYNPLQLTRLRGQIKKIRIHRQWKRERAENIKMTCKVASGPWVHQLAHASNCWVMNSLFWTCNLIWKERSGFNFYIRTSQLTSRKKGTKNLYAKT